MSKSNQTASRVHAGNDATSNTLRRSIKLRRNDPCPCGSGRKVKHCCGVHLEYNYDSFRPKVAEEHLLKEKPEWLFAISDVALVNEHYPEVGKRGQRVTITGRGYAANTATCYYRILFNNPEIQHKPTLWVADYCLDKEGGAK